MKFINTVLGIPLGYLIFFAYQATGSYVIAILLFAVFAKVVLFPVNVMTHKNSIRLLQLQPAMNRINQLYGADKERINEEQYLLYKKERYSPFVGIVPLFIQLILVIGVLQVMYHPLQHILHLDSNVIEVLVNTARNISGIQPGSTEQLLTINSIQQPQNLAAYQTALSGFPNATPILDNIIGIDLNFLGLNLGSIPSLQNPSILLIIPVLSGLSALLFCLVQNAISPGALSQGNATKWGLTIFTVAFSLYFAAVVPVGMGIYWTAGNILSLLVALLLDVLYSPKKLAGEALTEIEASRKTPEQIRQEKQEQKTLAAFAKKDAARFQAAEKHLVFYALTRGQYKYYKNIIEYVLSNSSLTIHYLTNDDKDPLLHDAPSGLNVYYADQRRTISLLLKLETDLMVTTIQDLQSYHMKRSIVKDDIEYIYLFHGLGSTHLTARETAYDHFDTVLCVGPHQAAELRRREEMSGMPKKRLVKAGYGLYDQLVEAYAAMPKTEHPAPRILIAPSWQADNILDTCIDDLLQAVLSHGYEIVVRPHPQYTNSFPKKLQALVERYQSSVSSGELRFELDFSGNDSIFSSDVLITDWSGIAFEFSYCTKKPSIFINTPMKVMNPRYEEYELEIVDITLRDKIGVSIDPEKLSSLGGVIQKLLLEKDAWADQIDDIVNQYIYYPMQNAEAGGKYLMAQLGDKINLH